MVITCNIEWENNPDAVYFSGQILNGRITLTNDKLENIKAILLKVQGYEATSWTETKTHLFSNKMSRGNLKYKGYQAYIDCDTYLMGNKESDDLVNFEPGIHTYTFASHIPANCPSSFEGEYGHIRYTVQVILIQQTGKNDLHFTKAITILRIFDLNYDTPLLKMPINTEIERSCFGPCRYLPLKIDLYLAQSGFVPGQQIPIDILFHTNHYLPDADVHLRLMMTIIYISQEPRKHHKQHAIIVSELKDKLINMRGYDKRHYQLPIPPTPPTCNNVYGLLQISYQVELQLKIKLMMIAEIVQAPVTIGNVPLLNVMEQQPRLITDSTNNKLLPWLTNDNIPKPIYKIAGHLLRVKINENHNSEEGHDQCDNEFTPKYTVFP